MADVKIGNLATKLTISAILLAVLLSCACAEARQGRADTTVKVEATCVLEKDFLGVGVQWSSYPWWDVSREDWNKVFRRVEFMRLPFVRVMLDAFWYCKGFDEHGKPVYDWNTSYMRKLYKLLDWCEKNNAKVMIGEWGRPAGKDLNLKNDDPKWTRIIGDFVEYMLREKKYTCLKYYNLVNEPHGSWSNITWDEWKTAIDNLHKELTKRGLIDSLPIASPDGDRKWTTKVLKDDQLRNQTAIYDEHWYVYDREINRGLLELYTRDQLRQIHKKDPGKQFFLGELGILDDKNKNDQQRHVFDFWYGVSMADAAIQMIRGGMSGFMAWDLDDSMHFNGDGGESMNALSDVLPDYAYERRKIWGFWSIMATEHGMPEEETLRPWFYPWSVLSRCFPPGCQTLDTEDAGVYQVRVAAARIPDGEKYHFSFAVANNYEKKSKVRIVVPVAGANVNLAKYEYFDANKDNKVDAWPKVVDDKGNDIFPSVTEVLKNVDLTAGLMVTLPSKGVVILTTLEGGRSIPLN